MKKVKVLLACFLIFALTGCKTEKPVEPELDFVSTNNAYEEVYNRHDVTISVCGWDYSDEYRPEMMVKIENNTENELTFDIADLLIEEKVFYPMWENSMSENNVKAGETVETKLYLDGSSLMDKSIVATPDNTRFDFIFYTGDIVNSTDDWKTGLLYMTNQAETDESTVGQVIYDDKGIIISLGEGYQSGSDNFSITFNIKNNMDKDIRMDIEECTINDLKARVSILPSTPLKKGDEWSVTMRILSADFPDEDDVIEISFGFYEAYSWERCWTTEKIQLPNRV